MWGFRVVQLEAFPITAQILSSMMQNVAVTKLAVPGVCILIGFLSYGPQALFRYINPSPLTTDQTLLFNTLVCGIWVCYFRACFTDAGRVPPNWKVAADSHDGVLQKMRSCRKCDAYKPPRAHHCKTCKRCVPKMDHHCPWTTNCVSHRTFPHFFRFLLYAVATMSYLEYLLSLRVKALWDTRELPSYMGPSPMQLIFLLLFILVNSIMLFVLSLLLFRNIWQLGANLYTIEGWEIERHESLVRRSKKFGGYLDGPDGVKVRIVKQEFPYDIGIFRNVQQGMGSNPLLWLWPFAPTPQNESGLHFETNGFEEPGSSWPPPDPDRMPRQRGISDNSRPFSFDHDKMSTQHYVEAFQRRQAQDLMRLGLGSNPFQRLSEASGSTFVTKKYQHEQKEVWTTSEGDSLEDYGVDGDADLYDEDELSLAEVRRRRKLGTLGAQPPDTEKKSS